MHIKSSSAVMTGSIEDMIAKLSVQLDDQAAEQRKASRRAEQARHEATLSNIDKQRDAATTQMLAGLVSAGSSVLSVTVGGTPGKLADAVGELGNTALGVHAKNQSLDVQQNAEQAKVMDNARAQYDDGAQHASRFADKALTHLSDVQRLIHESRMSVIRG